MTPWLRPSATVLLCVLAAGGQHPSAAVQAPVTTPAPCTAPEYRQFDFWIGDWEVFDAASSAPVAHVVVERILDGCVLREDYQGANGTRGQSFSTYDTARHVWHQSWVTNRGQLLVIEGGLEGREMVLAGDDPANGPRGRVRGVWTPDGGSVREVAVTSIDGGATWRPWFDLVFRKHVTQSDQRVVGSSGQMVKDDLRNGSKVD